jgi:hypothetical protein
MNTRVVLAIGVLAGAWPLGTAAQSREPTPYVAPKLILGFAGEADVEPAAVGGVSVEDDLEVSFGAGFAYMHPLHRHFALGGQLALAWWQTEGGDTANQDRNVVTDLSIVPQGVLPVSDDIELTLGLPIGLTLDFWGGDSVAAGVGGVATVMGDVNPAFGFNFGLVAGAHFHLSSSVGLLVELGYFGHSFTHEVEATVMTPVGTIQAGGEVDIALGQPRLLVGVSL